jgi:hypothetical protein
VTAMADAVAAKLFLLNALRLSVHRADEARPATWQQLDAQSPAICGRVLSMTEPVVAETERVLQALKAAIESSGLSIRAVERKADVSYTVFQKVLAGSTSLQFHHLLQILEAIRMDWSKFFNLCYPQPEKQAEPEPAPPPPPIDKAKQLVTNEALEERLDKLLEQIGFKQPPDPSGAPP